MLSSAQIRQGLDLRLVKVSIEVNGRTKIYQDVAIEATGTKYANSLQNECEITLTNLDRATQDYILTETSPYNRNRTPKLVTLEAGRVSYGTTKIFSGNVVSVTVTQPPDIGIKLKCLTGNFIKGNILTRSLPGTATLSQVSQQVAQDAGNLALNFQAADKNLANYSYAGAALKQVGHLGSAGGVNVFIDDNTLVVKNAGLPLTNQLTIVNQQTGMIGVPQLNERGVSVKFLVDSKTKLGGSLKVTSVENPSVNGTYVIYQIGFSICNRDTPFYYIAECSRFLL
jgi:hypothetical protein